MTNTTFDKLQDLEQQQNKPLRERYIALLLDDARGQKVPMDEIATLRGELNVDEAKLEKHLFAAKQFVQGEEILEKAKQDEEEKDQLTREIEKLLEQKRKFLEPWKAKFEPLEKRKFELSMRSGNHSLGLQYQRWAMETLEQ